MIDANELLERFLAHLATLKSTSFVATSLCGFESWFKAELVPALVEIGIDESCITTDYRYPNSRGKADLAILESGTDKPEIVFELKHFVQLSDSNKRSGFPGQADRLAELVARGTIRQGIALAVFSYLKESNPAEIISSTFAGDDRWLVTGPKLLLPGGFATVAIATTLV